MIFLMFSTVVGSVSFFGSIIAWGKLQELISGQPILIPGQQVFNGLILLAILAGAVYLVVDGTVDNEGIFIGVLAPRRSSACSSCCRSAAPTCRSSSRC